LGVTGLAARASGLQRDFRLQHPFGPYCEPEVQDLLRNDPGEELPVTITVEMSGDVYSRFTQRVLEVYRSARLIEYFLDGWPNRKEAEFLAPLDTSGQDNFEWGLGYVEGWRGDVVYWVMKDKFDRIYRCKVRDPSTLNWPGLAAAVAGAGVSEDPGWETTLVDFPVINKSFNLSYTGNDL
jgi:Ni,Fe-hydrogenase III large subunit